MKYAAWVGLVIVAAVALSLVQTGFPGGDLAAVSSASAADSPAGKPAPKPLPPLKVDRSAPLLLDEPAPKKHSGKGSGKAADNQSCHVCHTNFQDEELATVHAVDGVGCIKCHGESLAHRNDENNTTPPEVMYPANSIETACGKCHETHDVPAKKVLARWQERCAGKKEISQAICTDCHGHHRMAVRSVIWDKKTGKLLSVGQ